MKRICVYCGSNDGLRPQYAASARELAAELVERDLELVYGGATAGIMGVIADSMLELGGRVHGVLPKTLRRKELAHQGITELHVVETMHERKALMAELSDGFVALPGGFGTLEEIIEIVTWGQLRFHDKPCGVLNVDDYFGHLLTFIRHAEQQGFIRADSRHLLLSDVTPSGLLAQFDAYEAPQVDKWVSAS